MAAAGDQGVLLRQIQRVFGLGPASAMSESQLLERCLIGRDEVAFEALVARHGPMVWGVCRRLLRDPHDAEDAFQATFLVLLRRGGALREPGRLSPWLYGVAFRVASHARSDAARRRGQERHAARPEAVVCETPDEPDALRGALDEEIARLPENYRRPLVLCHLQGLSYDEAARRLRWTEGMVRGRLARARERLRSRLSRRGVVPAAWLAPGAASPTVPHALLAATAEVLVGLARVGVVSISKAPVVALAEGTLRSMMLTKIKGATATLLVIAAATLAVRASAPPSRGGPPPAAVALQAPAGPAAAPKPDVSEVGRSGRTLEIRVVDRRTGRPMPGVGLHTLIDGARTDAETDEAGRYVVRGIPPEVQRTVAFWANKEGFVPKTVSWRNDAANRRLPAVYTLEMEPGTAVGGLVRDEEGRPIAGATVYLRADCGRGDGAAVADLFEYPARTDAQGRWRCDLIPADADCLATRLVHPDFVSDRTYRDTPLPPRDQLRAQTAVMVMKRGATLFGTVLDADGRPVAGAHVRLGSDDWGSPRQPSTATDAEGRYRFQVAPGGQVLTVQADGHAPDLVHLPAVQGRTQVDFRLPPARSLRGRVVDREGKPIAGARVVANTWRGYRTLEGKVATDAEGRFRWDGAPDDEVLMNVWHAGYMPIRQRPMRASEPEVTITLSPQLRVRGSVVDAETGRPVEAFTVVPGVVIGRGEPSWMYDEARSAKDGRYEIALDDERSPHVRIEAMGYRPAVSRAFQADEGEQVYDFALRKGAAIAGVVRLPDGEALGGVEVLLVTPGQPQTINNGRVPERWRSPPARTGPDGRFTLPMPDGEAAVVVVHDRGFAERSARDLAADPVLTVRPWGRVEGTLRVGSKPGARLRIGADRRIAALARGLAPSLLHGTETDDEGRFVLDRVAPGEFYVGQELEMARGTTTTSGIAESVEVRPGETRRIALGGTGRPVVGRVVPPAGTDLEVDWTYGDAGFTRELAAPARPAGLDAEEAARWWRESDAARAYRRAARFFPFNVGPDGSFRVEDVPAGSYRLAIRAYAPPREPGAAYPMLGMVSLKFVVPEMPGGRSDEPLDLGTIALTPTRK